MLEVEDAEDPLTLLLLQQVVDEEQGVGVVLGLRVQIAVVHGQPPLPPTSFERTRTWEADLFEHSSIHPCSMNFFRILIIACSSSPFIWKLRWRQGQYPCLRGIVASQNTPLTGAFWQGLPLRTSP